jgi:hypothetical protein
MIAISSEQCGYCKATQATLRPMPEGLLFLKPLHLNRDGTCTDWDVRRASPVGGLVTMSVGAGNTMSSGFD